MEAVKTPNLDQQLMEFAQWFAALSDGERQTWLDEQQAANAARRRAECEARGGHVPEAGASACPHCDTPYSETAIA